MMRDVIESGTGAGAKALARPAAAKTGTAQDHRDAWFVGFTPGPGRRRLDRLRRPLAARGARDRRGRGAPGVALVHAGRGRRPSAVRLRPRPPASTMAAIDPPTGLRADQPAPGAATLAFLAGTAPAESSDAGAAPSTFFIDEQ